MRQNSLNLSDFWNEYKKKFPTLYKKLLESNMIVATSVPSESCFSISDYVQRKERSRLTPRNLRFLMFSKNFEQDQ